MQADLSRHLANRVLQGVLGFLFGSRLGVLVGRVVAGIDPLEQKEIGVTRGCLERIRHVDEHVGGPELHAGIPVVGEPRGPASGNELLASVDYPRPLVGPQGRQRLGPSPVTRRIADGDDSIPQQSVSAS